MSGGGEAGAVVDGDPQDCAVVCRSELGAALTEAAAAGAIVCDGIALTDLERHGDSVAVKTNRGDAVRARAVVVGTPAESPGE